MKSGLLSANPCQFVTLPKEEQYQAQFYTASQMQTLFEAIKDDPLAPLVRIAALYGLRRSELLGLQWDSIDFEAGLLTIKHTVSKVTKTVAKDKTKNASSHRSFPLTPAARAIFENAKWHETKTGSSLARRISTTPMCSNGRTVSRFPPTMCQSISGCY